MAETVADLLVKIGADVAGVETATAKVEQSLGKVASAGSGLSASLQPANRAAETLTRNLLSLAENGELSSGQMLSVGKAAASLANSFSSIATGAKGLDAAGASLAKLRDATLTASLLGEKLQSSFADVGASLVRLSPVAAVAGAGFALFSRELALAQQTLDNAKKRIDDFNKTAADGFTKLRDQVSDLRFEASIASMSEFEQAAARAARETQKIGEAANLSQGAIESLKADKLEAQIDAAMKKISTDSAKAAADLSANIRQASDAALADLDEFQQALNVKPADDTLAALRALGTEVNFSGPIAEIQKLQSTLDAAATKIADIGKKAGFEPEFIAGQIAEAQNKIKAAFSEDLKVKIHTDASAASDEVQKFLASIGGLPAAQLEVGFNISNAVRELDVLRARIADEPPGELKIALQAEASALEAKIAAARAAAEAPAVMPLDADTTKAMAKIDDLQKEIDQRFADAIDRVAGKSRSLGFFDPTDLNNALTSVPGTIRSGDSAEISQLLAGLKDFIHFNTGPSAVFGAGAANVALAQTAATALSRALTLLGGNPLAVGSASPFGRNDFADPINDLREKLAGKSDTQIDLLRESNDLAKANLDATRQVGASLAGGNIRTALTERIRRVTGDRSATL